jgi:hypothetical protein
VSVKSIAITKPSDRGVSRSSQRLSQPREEILDGSAQFLGVE